MSVKYNHYDELMDNDKTQIKSIKNLIENAESKKPYLVIMSGKDSGKEFPLYTGKITIGRKNTSDLYIDEQNVSRRHAEITFKNSKLSLTDLQSTNGTFVNGKPVDSCELKDGDLLNIGNYVLKVVYQHDVEKNMQEELYKSAVTDPLTGIYSKRYFLAKIESEFSRAVRYKRPLSLIIFDLDDFKKINDTYGHVAGDIVLKISAKLVGAIIRDTDTLARFGGEEFIVILPETALKDSKKLSEKIISAFNSQPFEAESYKINVTTSIGLAAKTVKTKSWKDLLVAADEKLYQAKKTGKNKVCT